MGVDFSDLNRLLRVIGNMTYSPALKREVPVRIRKYRKPKPLSQKAKGWIVGIALSACTTLMFSGIFIFSYNHHMLDDHSAGPTDYQLRVDACLEGNNNIHGVGFMKCMGELK